MSSPNRKNILSHNGTLAQMALLTGIGLILFLFETFIPRPLPWLKPGLAHIATLIALYALGNSAALIVVVGRIFLGAFLTGTFLNPAFILSFFGGVSATLIMILMKKHFTNIFSIYGISICGAIVHNITQLVLIKFLIVHQPTIFLLLPVMVLTSIFSGFVVAFISRFLIQKINLSLIQ
ncbi:MAG TPA: Gx transporter family protein [bacterium]|nr:Gx transporter family protein [bacterium]